MNAEPKVLGPSSPESEAALLGAILNNADVFLMVKPILSPDDFIILRHRYVYEAMVALSSQNDDIDNLTVGDVLRRANQDGQNRLAAVGGSAFLLQLMNDSPFPDHVRTYAGTIHRAAVRRRLLGALQRGAKLAVDEDAELKAIVDQIYAELDEVAAGGDGEGLVSFHQAVTEASDEWLGWMAEPQNLRGFLTGIQDLDELVGGFMPGRVTSLIMPTSGGKSTFMRQISLALVNQGPGLVIPTEMSFKSYIHSTISQCLGLKPHTLERGTPDPDERIAHEYSLLMDRQAHFLAARSPSIYDIEVAARRLRRRYGSMPLWMIVDSGSNVIVPKQTKIFETTKQVIGTLAKIAVDYNFHIFASWQINRESYSLDGAAITSARGGGDVENDSDLMFTIVREDYKEKVGLAKGNGKLLDFDAPVKATIKILKHRHSPIAGRVIPMWFKLGRGFFPQEEHAADPIHLYDGTADGAR